MARLDRTGDRPHLVFEDGTRFPWLLGEDRLADAGVEIPRPDPLATGPSALADNSFRMPGRVEDRFNAVAPDPTAMDPREVAARQGNDAGSHGARPSAIHGYQGVSKPTEEKNRQLAEDARTLVERKSKVSDAEAERLQADFDKRSADAGVIVPPGGTSKSETSRFGQEEGEAPDFGNQQGGQAGAGVGGGGIRKIPGGLRLEGFTRQVGASPEDMTALRESTEQATRSASDQAVEESLQQIQQNRFAKNELDGQIAYNQNRANEIRAQNATAKTLIADKTAERDTERANLQQAQQDPHRFWADKSTGAKIGAAIGMILAGIGGNQNAGKMFDDAIASDMAQHREKLAMRERGVNLMDDELTKLREKLDPDLAERELEGRMYLLSAAKLERNALATGDPAILAKARADIDRLRQQGTLLVTQNDREYGDRVTETVRNVPDQYVGTGARGLKPEQRERQIRFNGGQNVGFVVAGNARDKVQSAVTGWENLSSGMQELDSLAEAASAGNLDAQRRYNSLRSSLLTEGNVMRGQGAMSEGDQKNMEQGLPDISELTTTRSNARARISEQHKLANSRLRSVVRDNVYQDPDATTPSVRGTPRSAERE